MSEKIEMKQSVPYHVPGDPIQKMVVVNNPKPNILFFLKQLYVMLTKPIEVEWIFEKEIKQLYRFLTTKKCEAKGCISRLEKPYRWCSFECFAYCGGQLKPTKEIFDSDNLYYCVFCNKKHLCDIVKTKYGEDLVCTETLRR